MKKFLRNNGLSLSLFVLFLICFISMSITGFYNYNEEQTEHGKQTVSISKYLGSGNFWEATGENLESEFLQMFFYLFLTAILYQKGSAESRDPDKEEEVDKDPFKNKKKDSPWPVKKGGIILKLYENSLSIAFLLLFFISFLIHGIGGANEYNEDMLTHGKVPVSLMTYFFSSRFWFESFQNWQSEFFSIGAMVVLSIFLRQKGSPESKPVYAANSETGG